VDSVAFAPDGTLPDGATLVVGDSDGVIYEWSITKYSS
jgi:hypothetical protein